MAANTQIPGYAKTLMAVAAVFMPVFLILPFFFWGNENNQINLAEQDIQAGRLAPVGRLNIASATPASAGDSGSAAAFNPETTYQNVCAACHATGVLNAPKLGDDAAWQAKINERGGIDAIIKQGIQGLNAMPPKGGATVSDEEFGRVVKYMLKNSNIAVEDDGEAATASEAADAPAATAAEGSATTDAPAETTPAAETAAEQAPATDAPAETATENAPVADAPAETTPAAETAAEVAPATDTPAATAAEGSATTDAPAETTPAAETAAEQAPATDAPAETAAEGSATTDAPVETAPAAATESAAEQAPAAAAEPAKSEDAPATPSAG